MKPHSNRPLAPQSDAMPPAHPQARMEAYLQRTHQTFLAAVEQTQKLSTEANGVLAGPRVRL